LIVIFWKKKKLIRNIKAINKINEKKTLSLI
jgi:hypothetical protein